MRLLVTTPMAVVVDRDDVVYVRAEDETGVFGILPGHADFITALSVSIVAWRDAGGVEHLVAVRGGVFTMRDGTLAEIATRGAVSEDTFGALDRGILERFEQEAEAEAQSRTSATRLHLAAIRQIQRFLQSGRKPVAIGAPETLQGMPTEQTPMDSAEAE